MAEGCTSNDETGPTCPYRRPMTALVGVDYPPRADLRPHNTARAAYFAGPAALLRFSIPFRCTTSL
ncbi:MAG: hypothetical protein H7330_12550 [Hymenobacteraceae bacterium]|nr:hypothetical protein [Hymenobacteraceae bacterium]